MSSNGALSVYVPPRRLMRMSSVIVGMSVRAKARAPVRLHGAASVQSALLPLGDAYSSVTAAVADAGRPAHAASTIAGARRLQLLPFMDTSGSETRAPRGDGRPGTRSRSLE